MYFHTNQPSFTNFLLTALCTATSIINSQLMIAYEPGQPEFKQTKRTLMEFCEGKGVSNENECNINSSRSICMKLCNEMTDSCSIKLFEWKQTPAKLKKLLKRKQTSWDTYLYQRGNPYGYVPAGSDIWGAGYYSEWERNRRQKFEKRVEQEDSERHRDLQVHCIGCHNNTEGRLCQNCEPLYYNEYNKDRARHLKNFQHIWRVPVECKPCMCHPEGSKSAVCHQEETETHKVGSCECKDGYKGKNCDSCDENFNMTRPLSIVAPQHGDGKRRGGDIDDSENFDKVFWRERPIHDDLRITEARYNKISYPYKTWRQFNDKGILPTNNMFDPESFYEYPICVPASCPIVATVGSGGSYRTKTPTKETNAANRVCSENGDHGASCEMGNCKCTENSQPRYHGKLCEFKWEKKDVEEELRAITGGGATTSSFITLRLFFGFTLPGLFVVVIIL